MILSQKKNGSAKLSWNRILRNPIMKLDMFLVKTFHLLAGTFFEQLSTLYQVGDCDFLHGEGHQTVRQYRRITTDKLNNVWTNNYL